MLATMLSNSAMKRAETAGQKLDDERAFIAALQRAVKESMAAEFGAHPDAIQELGDRLDEQFLQTRRFTQRNVSVGRCIAVGRTGWGVGSIGS